MFSVTGLARGQLAFSVHNDVKISLGIHQICMASCAAGAHIIFAPIGGMAGCTVLCQISV